MEEGRMKLHAFASALIGLAVLAGCATAEGYRQQMDTWKGRSGDDLIIEWGQPTSRAPLSDGREVWNYVRSEEIRTDAYYTDEKREVKRTVTDKDGNQKTETITETYPVLHPARTSRSTCETRFVMSNRIVLEVTFAGDACVAEEK
jgi:hypothetical protein